MMVAASQDHVIAICDVPRLASDKQWGKPESFKDHMIHIPMAVIHFKTVAKS